jgi:hypothetical protein
MQNGSYTPEARKCRRMHQDPKGWAVIPPNQQFSAVCMRGHVITDSIPRDAQWERAPRFCRQCGAPVLTECPAGCSARILGYNPNRWRHPRQPDPFCWHCGKPYPWATRAQRIGHLYNLIDFQPNLDEADRLTITEQVAVLSESKASDEQRVEAGSRIRRLAPKAWEACCLSCNRFSRRRSAGNWDCPEAAPSARERGPDRSRGLHVDG